MSKRVVWNKDKKDCYSEETLKIMSLRKTGVKRIPHTEETKAKMRHPHKSYKKRGPSSEETKQKISKKLKNRKIKPESIERMKATKKSRAYIPSNKGKNYEDYLPLERAKEIKSNLSKKARKQCLEGHAAYMNSFIKDDSKPENKLFILACKLLPRPVHKYPIYRVGKGKRSYNADIADSSLGIIIEYDGWHHFNIPGRKEYDVKRQQELEKDGWKFLRYNIFQKFPTLEQVKEDLLYLLVS